LRNVKGGKKERENGKKSQKFLPEEFQKEGSSQNLQGNLRPVRKRIVIGGSPTRERSSLLRLLQ